MRRWDLAMRENSDLRLGSWSSDLEWSWRASKKMRKWKGRGVGRARIWFRRVSEMGITPDGEVDWRWLSSERRLMGGWGLSFVDLETTYKWGGLVSSLDLNNGRGAAALNKREGGGWWLEKKTSFFSFNFGPIF